MPVNVGVAFCRSGRGHGSEADVVVLRGRARGRAGRDATGSGEPDPRRVGNGSTPGALRRRARCGLRESESVLAPVEIPALR